MRYVCATCGYLFAPGEDLNAPCKDCKCRNRTALMDHFNNKKKEVKNMYKVFLPGDPPEKKMMEDLDAEIMIENGEAFMTRGEAIAAYKGCKSVADEVLAPPVPEEEDDEYVEEKEEDDEPIPLEDDEEDDEYNFEEI